MRQLGRFLINTMQQTFESFKRDHLGFQLSQVVGLRTLGQIQAATMNMCMVSARQTGQPTAGQSAQGPAEPREHNPLPTDMAGGAAGSSKAAQRRKRVMQRQAGTLVLQ